MATITQSKQEKINRNKEIKSKYAELMKPKGSQKTAAYAILSAEYGLNDTQIGRIVGNIK